MWSPAASIFSADWRMKEKVPLKCLYLSARLHGITAWNISLCMSSSIHITVITQNNKNMISKVSMMFCWSYEFHFKEQVRSNSNVPHFFRLNITHYIYQMRLPEVCHNLPWPTQTNPEIIPWSMLNRFLPNLDKFNTHLSFQLPLPYVSWVIITWSMEPTVSLML